MASKELTAQYKQANKVADKLVEMYQGMLWICGIAVQHDKAKGFYVSLRICDDFVVTGALQLPTEMDGVPIEHEIRGQATAYKKPVWEIKQRDHFGLLEAYCVLLETGKKETTIRCSSGAIDVPASYVLPVIARPRNIKVFDVKISSWHTMPFGSLTEQDALRDGFDTYEELMSALGNFYGAIAADQPVTIYHIKKEN